MKGYKIKKPKNLLFWVIVVVLVLVHYINNFFGSSVIEQNIEITYAENKMADFEVEQIVIKDKKIENIVIKSFFELKDRSKNLVPKKLEIIDVLVEDKTAIINFTREYNDLDFDEEKVFRSILTKTLESIEGVDRTNIKVNGSYVLADENTRDIHHTSDKVETENKVKLYFVDRDEVVLKQETRNKIETEMSDEEYIIYELLKGTKDENLMSTIPEGTVLNSIKVENETAYVDLNELFVENQTYALVGEENAIYSIVNSLTELENINRVQFLINGKVEKIYSHIEIDKPFERRVKQVQDDI